MDDCKLDPLSCCGRNKKGQAANITCCDRLVLIPSRKNYLPLYKLSQKGEESLGIPLAENFLKYDRVGREAPRPFGKKMPVKWCAVKFRDKAGTFFASGGGCEGVKVRMVVRVEIVDD